VQVLTSELADTILVSHGLHRLKRNQNFRKRGDFFGMASTIKIGFYIEEIITG